MERFVKAGSIDEKDILKQELKENKAREDFRRKLEETDRKSLAEQLAENKEAKEREYQDLLHQQNSSHKLSHQDVEFYNQLRKRKLQEERRHSQRERNMLEDFLTEKKTHERDNAVKWGKKEFKRKKITPLKPKTETIQQPNTLISGYSSSDDDDE